MALGILVLAIMVVHHHLVHIVQHLVDLEQTETISTLAVLLELDLVEI